MASVATIDKYFYKPYDIFLQETPDIVDDPGTGTVYMAWFRPNEGDGAKTLAACKALNQWAVVRLTTTAGVTVREWANGNMNFDTDWNNRATHTYHIRNFK